MKAEEVMTTPVVTVLADTDVAVVTARLLRHRVSACPVVDEAQRLVGIVSEADLMARAQPRKSDGWRQLLLDPEKQAGEYIRAHAREAKGVMTREVVSVSKDADLEEIAKILLHHKIKRVPVVEDGKVVGIVSRADLLRGSVQKPARQTARRDDSTLRAALSAELAAAGVRTTFLYTEVTNGILRLWGAVESRAEKEALRTAVQNVSGHAGVDEHVSVLPSLVRSMLWAQ